jgi:hypothetical protein
MRGPKVILVAALGALFAQMVCVAACAGELGCADPGQAMPAPACPRHHNQSHDRTSPPCAQHFVVSPEPSRLSQGGVSGSVVVGRTTTFSAILPLGARAYSVDFATPSPPEQQKLSISILRI